MKRLMALITMATITLGSATIAFASEIVPLNFDATTQVPTTEATEVPNVQLKAGEKSYYNDSGIIVGVYPSFENNKALTTKIANLVNDTYQQDVVDNVVSESYINMKLYNYVITETATHAKIEITKTTKKANQTEDVVQVIATYYIDKATNQEVKATDYEALLPVEPVVGPEGTIPATELTPSTPSTTNPEVSQVLPATIPLRANAESLGYVVGWENGLVTVSKDGKTAYLAQGSASFTNFNGETVDLGVPATNVDGTLVVPTAFFTQILGATITVNADGTISITETVPATPVVPSTPADTETAPAA